MVERFMMAAIVAAILVCGTAYAQSPPADELNLAQQQLANKDRAYDDLERKVALTVQADQKAIQDQQAVVKRWQDYYNSCKPAEKWLCDE